MSAQYGNDFGDLQRNLNTQAAQRQAALAHALDTATQALSAAREHQTELQRLATQKDQFAQELSLRKSEADQRKAESDRNFQLAKDNAGLNERYVKLAEKTEADKALQLTPAKQREHDMTLQQASDDANNGTFDSVDHVKKLYPDLSPAEQSVVFERNLQARRQIVSDHVTAENAAGVLNANNSLKQRIYQIDQTDLPEAQKHTGFWSTVAGSNQSDKVTALQNERKSLFAKSQQIAPIAESLSKDKNVNQLITFDPVKEQYVSTLSAPRWMTEPLDNSGKQGGEDDSLDEAAPYDRQAPAAGTTGTANTGTTNRTMPTSTATATVGGDKGATVKVRTRDGTVWNVPQGRLRDALARGAVPVPTDGPVQSAPSGSALNLVERGMLH